MPVQFKMKVNRTVYHDPKKNFELNEAISETRYDPLTGQLVRIFPFRKIGFPRHDWLPYAEESRQRFCPFCPGTLEVATPRFQDDFIPGGRLRVGEAVVIPNLHPYEIHTGVVVMTPTHYVPVSQLTQELMFNSFSAGLAFLQLASKVDPDGAIYGSINWNYMPYAGGSLIHPHLQVLAGPEPTTYAGDMIKKGSEYYRLNQSNYWNDFIDAERVGSRYLGSTGDAEWFATFAPRAMTDVTAVFPGKTSIWDFTRQDTGDLVQGLQNVISYYDAVNIPSFNVALYFSRREDRTFTVNARVVGRFTIFPQVGSDFSHLQVLHNDPWTLHLPEKMAEELRVYFK